MFKINWCKIFGHKTYTTERLLVYSSVRKANIDRNFMVKWLKNHDSKL